MSRQSPDPEQAPWYRTAPAFVKSFIVGLWRRFMALNWLGKLTVLLIIAILSAETIFIVVVTPKKIFQVLYNWAKELSETRLGWLILGGVIAAACMPPLPGHTTAVSLAGFAYGMKGFAIAAGASLLGAIIVFLLLRLTFSKTLRKWASTNKNWAALEAVIKKKGLPLVILIRASPFPPWTYNTAFFASIDSVKLWQFIVATFFVFPKILLHVFIGSQAADLSDEDRRNKMTPATYAINIIAIVAGILVAICASWFTYREMQKQIKGLEDSDSPVANRAAEALERAEEGAPLLRSFSDEED